MAQLLKFKECKLARFAQSLEQAIFAEEQGILMNVDM
jgi:hypothetical protein